MISSRFLPTPARSSRAVLAAFLSFCCGIGLLLPGMESARASSAPESHPIRLESASRNTDQPLPPDAPKVTDAVSFTPVTPAASPSTGTVVQVTGPTDSRLPAANTAETTNTAEAKPDEDPLQIARERLEIARHMRTLRQLREAEPVLVELLAAEIPDSIQQLALLELAAVAQDENNLSRAQQVYAQFISRWPNDLRIPEILLRQGEVFRQMGLNNMALTKFYAVMTSALVLKNDQFDYYASLVLRAQTEIAETHYQLGKYGDAAEFLTRLLKQDTGTLDKSQVLYKLNRCQLAMGHYDEVVASGQDYLQRYMNGAERPEVQFNLAMALKQLGRDNEALQQVLALLSEQRANANSRPDIWAYWQQRTGNVIANQLYREGDYPKALDIYTSLAQLDPTPEWQLPVQYQIGMTYERLMQPQKATEAYANILKRESEFSTNTPPSLKAVFDMARWRTGFIQWQEKAEAMNREVRTSRPTPPAEPLASTPTISPALP